MTKAPVIEGLRAGDIVRHSRTMEVTYADGQYAELQDKKNPTVRIGLYSEHKGSDRIEVLCKARPTVGAVITAQELLDTPWRRGTVVKTERRFYMLAADGDWYTPALPEDEAEGLVGGFYASFGWMTTHDGDQTEHDYDIRFTVVSLP